MNIVEVYKRFPSHDSCLKYLEQVRWKGQPICPYCGSTKSTPMPKERRHHCGDCKTSYRVTVRTIFHKTKVDLQKWFLAITLMLNAKKGISSRQLSRDIGVNKNTAWYMNMRIRRAMREDRELMMGIVEVDETYIGGKRQKGSKRGRGTKKTPVVGIAERGGNVKARVSRKLDSRRLSNFVRENVDTKETTVITDEFKGYLRLSSFVNHRTINHAKWYVDGDVHTNNIESFWALLKRGIIGQFHKVSTRHLARYIDEFCYRHNNRRNPQVFELTLARAVGGI